MPDIKLKPQMEKPKMLDVSRTPREAGTMLREQYDTQRSAAGPKEKSPVRSATDSVEAAGRRSAVLSAEAARRGVKGGIAELKEKNAAQRQQAANADTNNSGFQDAAPSPQERLRRETAA